MARSFEVVPATALQVGDVIAPWGTEGGENRTARITDIKPYTGPLKTLWDKHGGAKLASLEPFGTRAFKARGITLDPSARYYRLTKD